MSDTEVSLTAAECREYVLNLFNDVWSEHLSSIASVVQVQKDSPDKERNLRALAEFKQAEQWLKAKLGC